MLKKKKMVIAGGIGAGVLIVILIVVLLLDVRNNKIRHPESREVLASISADGSIADTIVSFEVSDWKTNSSGSTCTATCKVQTENKEYSTIVIYELEHKEWKCTQVIVK